MAPERSEVGFVTGPDQLGGQFSAGLQGFGLTEYESKVYVALLAGGPSSVNQLQFSSHVPRTKVYQTALQLIKKGVVKELEGKPVRFEAMPPEVFESVLAERERGVRTLRRVMTTLKKVRERNMMPQDSVEERYLSLGSQSVLLKLKESIVRAQRSIKCIADGWGFHLIQECSEELEGACSQEVEVKVVASVPPALPTFPFASSRMVVRYGRHLAGKSAFIIDDIELIIVNSQTGRGYQFLLGDLKSTIGDELFNEFWRSSTSARAVAAVSNTDDLSVLSDGFQVNRFFIEAVARSLKDERYVEAIGTEFLNILEEKAAPRLRHETFENAVKLILALMEEDLGEAAMAEYDPLTRIFRMELPNREGIPGSAWYFALSGLLKSTGTKNELLNDASFPEARSRIIQRKFAPGN